MDWQRTFPAKMGITLVKSEAGHSQYALEVNEKILNAYETVHGGACFTLADVGMGSAFASTLGEGESCVTTGVNIVFLRGATSGVMVCNSRVLSRGKNVGTVEAEITNEGQLVAKALGTFAVLKQQTKNP